MNAGKAVLSKRVLSVGITRVRIGVRGEKLIRLNTGRFESAWQRWLVEQIAG